jgi:hypothetical protein
MSQADMTSLAVFAWTRFPLVKWGFYPTFSYVGRFSTLFLCATLVCARLACWRWVYGRLLFCLSSFKSEVLGLWFMILINMNLVFLGISARIEDIILDEPQDVVDALAEPIIDKRFKLVISWFLSIAYHADLTDHLLYLFF